MGRTTTDAAEVLASRIFFCLWQATEKINSLLWREKMYLSNNHNLKYVAYLALLSILLAIVVKFDGTVSVKVTPLSLRVVVDGYSPRCLIDSPLPEAVQPKLPKQELL
jgi:hypothetical protein